MGWRAAIVERIGLVENWARRGALERCVKKAPVRRMRPGGEDSQAGLAHPQVGTIARSLITDERGTALICTNEDRTKGKINRPDL